MAETVTTEPTTNGKGNLLHQDKKGVVHFCEGNEVHRGVTLIWTLCNKDVPANGAFRSWEGSTCMECALARDQRNLESMGAV